MMYSSQSHNSPIEPIVSEFKKAVEGLYFISEYDYPFEIFHWKNEDQILSIKEKSLKKTSVEIFFNPLIEEEKFLKLLQLINKHLSDVEVYRIGNINVEIYIIGKIKSSSGWIVLKTRAVET